MSWPWPLFLWAAPRPLWVALGDLVRALLGVLAQVSSDLSPPFSVVSIELASDWTLAPAVKSPSAFECDSSGSLGAPSMTSHTSSLFFMTVISVTGCHCGMVHHVTIPWNLRIWKSLVHFTMHCKHQRSQIDIITLAASVPRKNEEMFSPLSMNMPHSHHCSLFYKPAMQQLCPSNCTGQALHTETSTEDKQPVRLDPDSLQWYSKPRASTYKISFLDFKHVISCWYAAALGYIFTWGETDKQ